MLPIVRRNPTEVCRVSAVPTACGGAISVTSAENCAESAITATPPDEADARGPARPAAEHQPCSQRAAPLTTQRQTRTTGRDPSGRRHAPPEASHRPDRHRGKAPRLPACAADSPRAANGAGQKRRNPGPERIQLPHVTEVSAGDFAEPAVPGHLRDESPRERPRRKGMRSIAIADANEDGCTQRGARGHQHGKREREMPGTLQQIGDRLADGERPDDRADGQPAARAEPGGGHLHRRRIDSGQRHAGQDDPAMPVGRCREQQRRVGDGPEQRSCGDVSSSGNQVGEIQNGGEQRAENESELHTRGEPASLARGE